MAIKRAREHDPLTQVVLTLLYKEASKYTKDGKWREFTGEMKINGAMYLVKCKFQLTAMFFNYDELKIELSKQEPSLIWTPQGAIH